MTRYYVNPFANVGDRADIPDAIQPSGSVSYEQGYGSDYELDLITDPSAKAFPRNQNNQFCYDVTENIQQFQQYGVPLFIPSMTNSPGTYSYDAGVCVRYDDGGGFKIYQSLVSGNTALPTDSTKWQQVTINDNSFYVYTSNFGVGVSDGDFVAYSVVSSAFEKAIAGNTVLENAIGVAEPTKNRIQILSVSNLFSGLTPGSQYFLSSVTAGAITLIPTTGITAVAVGVAISSTELVIAIQKELGTDEVLPYGTVSFTLTGSQSVGTGNTVIQFDNVISDLNSWWDNSTFSWLPTKTGYYKFSSAVFGTAVNPGGNQGTKLYKNGSWAYWVANVSDNVTYSCVPSGISPPIYLNGSTDFVQLVWYAGVASAVLGTQSGTNSDKNFFSIEYLGQ